MDFSRNKQHVTCPHCGEVDDAIKWGKTRGGNSRLRCMECLRTFVAGPPLAGNHLPPEKEERLMEALCSGLSIRASAKAAGVSRATAQKYSRGLKVKCPCGDNARHRGWCWFRVQRSPARRKFLAERFGASSIHQRFRLKKAVAAEVLRDIFQGTPLSAAAESAGLPLSVVKRLASLSDSRKAELLRKYPAARSEITRHASLVADATIHEDGVD